MKTKDKSSNKKVKKVVKNKKNWKKVKIAGNLVSDDGGGLEGLVGLEVLEDYDIGTVLSGKKRKYKEESESDSESDQDLIINNNKKKKNNKKANQTIKNENTIPGQFVRLHPPNNEINESNDTNKIDEGDTTDDLKEWESFGISETILKALKDKGFKTPTPIQTLTLPPAMMGKKDILGAAETGSGKTLAFGIPILNEILNLKSGIPQTIRQTDPKLIHIQPKQSKKRKERENFTPPPEEINNFPQNSDKDANSNDSDAERKSKDPLYALILTPTRELAVQVKDHLVAAAKYTNIKIAAIFGGMAHVKQERVLKQCPEIVVATPGRLWELITEGNAHLNKLMDINFLVIDEADRMIEKGHFEELKLLLSRLNADPERKNKRQTFVFSATLSLVHELPSYLQNKRQKIAKQTSGQKLQNLIVHLGMVQPKIVDITNARGTAQLLTECRITCQIDQKDLYLYYFLQRHPGRTIVFCNSIDCVKRLGQLFGLLNCQPRPLHAQMNQKRRLKNLEKFAASPAGLLIATDVAARGLDIPNVQHVIHYQVPRTSENYVHRSGRTARANNEGITVILMEPTEMTHYLKLCRTLGKAEDLPLFPISDKYLKAVKSRVDLAREVDKLELKSRRTQSEIGWLKKSAKEMDIIVDDMSDFSENEMYDSDDGGERHKIRRILKAKRDTLNALLAKQLFPKGFSYKYPTSTGHLEFPLMDVENNKENAVEVMKTAIEETRIAKKHKAKKM